MIIGEIQTKKLSFDINKKCTQAEINKLLSFRGEFPNTFKYHPSGTFIYPSGNNLVIQNNKKQQKILTGHDNSISAISLSSTGSFMVSGQLGSKNSKNYESPLIVWDCKKYEIVKILNELKDGVKNVLISRDQNFIAATSLKNHLMVWNAKTLNKLHSKVYEFSINLLSFEQNLIMSIEKSLVQLSFSTPNLPVQTPFTIPSTGLPRNYTTVALWKAQSYFIGTQGGEICYFQKGVFKSVYNLGKGKVNSIIINNKTNVFALISNELIKLNFPQNLVEKTRIQVPQGISLVNNQKQIYVEGRGRLYRINVDNLKVQTMIETHASKIIAIGYKANLFATLEASGLAIIRDVQKLNITTRCAYNKPLQATCITIAEDYLILIGWVDGTIKAFKYSADKYYSPLQWQLNAHKDKTLSVFANQNYILSGGEDAVVRIWGRKNRQLLNQISVHQKGISKVIPDIKIPNYIHSCSYDKSVHTYDLKTDKKVNFHQAKNGIIYSMDQRKDADILITCGANIPISFWDLKNFAPVDEIEFPYKLFGISISPSGKYMCFGCQTGQIYLFEVKTKNFLGKAAGHSQDITDVKWINQNTIISVSIDGSTAVWKIKL